MAWSIRLSIGIRRQPFGDHLACRRRWRPRGGQPHLVHRRLLGRRDAVQRHLLAALGGRLRLGHRRRGDAGGLGLGTLDQRLRVGQRLGAALLGIAQHRLGLAAQARGFFQARPAPVAARSSSIPASAAHSFRPNNTKNRMKAIATQMREFGEEAFLVHGAFAPFSRRRAPTAPAPIAPSSRALLRRRAGQASDHGGRGLGGDLPQCAHRRRRAPPRCVASASASCFSSRSFSVAACWPRPRLRLVERGVDRRLCLGACLGGGLADLRRRRVRLLLRLLRVLQVAGDVVRPLLQHRAPPAAAPKRDARM